MAQRGFTIEIRGLEQLRKKLDKLGAAGVKKAMRPALRAGQKIMTKAAQAAAPVRTGLVKRNIKTRAMRRSRKHFGMRTVLGEGFYKGKTFYGAFQEFGWHPGKRTAETKLAKKEGREDSRRFVPGKHFMEGAGKANARHVGDVIIKLAIPAIEAEAAKRG